MAAPMSRCRFQFVFVFFIILFGVAAQSELEELQPIEVEDRIERGCVFLLLSPENEVLWNNFVTLTAVFRETKPNNRGVTLGLGASDIVRQKEKNDKVNTENNRVKENTTVSKENSGKEGNSARPGSPRNGNEVFIGYHRGPFLWGPEEPLKWKENQGQTGEKMFNKPHDTAFFPRKKKDRSCLIKPLKVRPRAESYDWGFDAESMLHFINSKCDTYKTLEGKRSHAGVFRDEILANLFHVREVSNVTMAGLWHSLYAREGKEFHSEDSDGVCVSEARDSCIKEGSSASVVGTKHWQPQADNDHAQESSSSSNIIPQCTRLSHSITKEEFFHNYLIRSKPFILENAVSHWTAFTKWTKEFFLSRYKNEKIHIKLAPNGVFEGVEDVSLWEDHKTMEIPPYIYNQLPFPDLVVVRPGTANIRFAEFSDMMDQKQFDQTCSEKKNGTSAKVSAYLEYSSISHFPELEKDVEELDLAMDLLEMKHLNIWLSDGDTLGKLHFDPFDNFLCQIRGKKQLTLFEPHDNSRLYEAHIPEALLGYDKSSQTFRRKTLLDSTSMVMSPLDILNPDFKRFPRFADARPLNCTINEGDVLFMPAFWWHEVQSYPNITEGRNLAVNFWYEPFLQKEFPCQECKLDVNPKYRHLLR
ncbi:JmjC domain-containing protein 7 [Holothuria leucospilota]|uniref:JmjC domain-containing protein 7 n=1 Tax=Holothuria leucospilota TaxID=206669 RepID=A0A9Q0YJF4_HOLLE|nr:JmjC domain-containing protein 7 [Holothuria leucospilota]